MKTDDLIAALAADAPAGRFGQTTVWCAALLVAALLAAAAFAMLLTPRADLALVAGSPRFLFKFLFAGSLAAAAFAALSVLSRPVGRTRSAAWIAAAPALLLMAVGLELAAVPSAEWGTRLVGRNYMACLIFIPTIGLAPLALFMAALRRGAPSHPVLAGAICGLLSGGLAALFYATHCPDDSPLFVATWYTLGIAALTGLGALAGRFFARW